MSTIRITGDFRALQIELTKAQLRMKREVQISLKQSAKVVKDNIKVVMREKKSGVLKPKYLQRPPSPIRRSAMNEALARDTGRAENRIANSNPQNNSIEVGFKKDNGFDYVQYWEFNGRPTLAIANLKSLQSIQNIFRRNLKIDK